MILMTSCDYHLRWIIPSKHMAASLDWSFRENLFTGNTMVFLPFFTWGFPVSIVPVNHSRNPLAVPEIRGGHTGIPSWDIPSLCQVFYPIGSSRMVYMLTLGVY